VDGNRYIDYALAWGPLILGHRHPQLVEAMRRQAERPHVYGAQHELECRVAERVQAVVPCAELVAFTSSGSEAVQLALRLSRIFTGRNLILKFEGHYHGWMDSVMFSYHPGRDQIGPTHAPHPVPGAAGQVPNAAENLIVAPWNRIEILERIFSKRGSEIAAVIMEPVLCNSGSLLPLPNYLQDVKNLCQQYGSLLIFDEVITGFRLALGGAQSLYGIVPDLATFGKAMAGGVPLSAVAGRKEILELMFGIGNGVVFGGTFNGNPLSMASALATLDQLAQDDGAPLAQANQVGRMLMEGIRRVAQKHGIPLVVTGLGTAFTLHFTSRTELRDYRDTLEDDQDRLGRFLVRALDEGVYVLPDGRHYLSVVHTEDDVAETLNAYERVFEGLS
jgi:glutamate-1-semialdehyde 2,1-aminomutase